MNIYIDNKKIEATAERKSKLKGIVSAISKLSVVKPINYDWKQDYIKALEEKYESIYRR